MGRGVTYQGQVILQNNSHIRGENPEFIMHMEFPYVYPRSTQHTIKPLAMELPYTLEMIAL